MLQEQRRPAFLREVLLNVWRAAPQTRPRCTDSSALHHSRQVPQAIFVVSQLGYLLGLRHINRESTYRCRRQALTKYPDPETKQQRQHGKDHREQSSTDVDGGSVRCYQGACARTHAVEWRRAELKCTAQLKLFDLSAPVSLKYGVKASPKISSELGLDAGC